LIIKGQLSIEFKSEFLAIHQSVRCTRRARKYPADDGNSWRVLNTTMINTVPSERHLEEAVTQLEQMQS
jgi:hypothetical protein